MLNVKFHDYLQKMKTLPVVKNINDDNNIFEVIVPVDNILSYSIP